MKQSKRLFALLLTLAMTLGMLTACGGSNSDTSSEGDGGESSGSNELTVYTAFPEAEVAYYFNAFEEATGIKVNALRLSAGEMLTRVAAEKDNPQASLMFGGSTDNYIAASNQGLLEAYQSPELSNTPENYLDPDGVWNPIYVGAIAFACNKDWFADKGYDYPTSWDDLLDPKYQDMIIMAHPATSGTAYTVLATLIRLMGLPEGAGQEHVPVHQVRFRRSQRRGPGRGGHCPDLLSRRSAAHHRGLSHRAVLPHRRHRL